MDTIGGLAAGRHINEGADKALYQYSTITAQRESISVGLKRQLQECVARQQRIEALLALLERNPDIEQFIDLSREI